MTDQQFNAIMAAISAVSRGEKLVWNSGLVGDSQIKPPAPNEAASNPGAWVGTRWDPLEIDNIHVSVTQVFETIPQAFIGGKFYDWYRKDPTAAENYYASRYKVGLPFDKLAPSQRAQLGLGPKL